MKRILIILLFVVLVPFIMKAEWVPLDNNRTAATPPKVTILSNDPGGMVIRVEISGFNVSRFTSGDHQYQSLDLMTESLTDEPGSPEVPYIAKILAVPDMAAVSVEVLETGPVQVFRNIELPPARPSWIEGQLEPPYQQDSRAYQSNAVYPSEQARLDPPAIMRDFRITRFSVFPMRYVPARKELQVSSYVTIKVTYGKGEVINPKTTPKKKIAPSWGQIYRSTIMNYQEVLERDYSGREDGRDLILVIVPDAFYNTIQSYEVWKRQTGIDVHVTKFSDIGANSTNPDIIKEHIANAYHNWDNPPTYVQLVGDDGICPKKIVTYPDYSFPNEDYFVEIDGNDYFPELFIGRMPNQNDSKLQVMTNKFRTYEKTPYTNDTTWFKKGTVCSNNAYASQVETKRFAYHEMMDNGDFFSVDTMMSDGNWWGGDCTYNIDDIKAAINNGRSYLNYRGEGWYDGWQASCYNFLVPDVSSLQNGQKFTFVTSIGCGVAGFQNTSGNCFGEEWIELGTVMSPRGACGFLGPTSNTHTTYNNKIDKGIYIGMFEEGIETPGAALLRGKLYMYEILGNEYYVEYHYKIYCCLGDPSIHVWRKVPKEVNVSYPASIPVADNQVHFTVTYASNGHPVGDAEVVITGDQVFATGYTDSTGNVIIPVETTTEDTLTVTVRGLDVKPFQGPMEVIQYDVLVEPFGNPAVIDIDGNHDGLINPNEHCTIHFILKNWGIFTATNVMATLTTVDPDYVEIITTDPVSYGNIASYSTGSGSPFEFYVKPNCKVDQSLRFQLTVTSDTNTWNYYQIEEVKGCKLDFQEYAIFDPGSGDMNFRLDPGETDVVVIELKNIGQDLAPGVKGILRSDDPYITVTDSTGDFGSMSINGISKNMENVFMVAVSPSCPANYMADISVKLNTTGGNYPYNTELQFQLPVSKPVPHDYTGPDAYGYYAYTSDDSFFDETPQYNWRELEGVGTKIALPLISDYTTSMLLPFTFKFYGVDYYELRISTDGWVAFGPGNQTAPDNTMLPHVDNVNSMVAAFWDDLYDNENFYGEINYYNDVANHVFIVEWDSISHNHYINEPYKENFEVILFDPDYYPTSTGDGEILVQYRVMKDPASVTVGIENNTQDIGLQYVFNSFYDPTASPLEGAKAIKFTTDPPFANILTEVQDQPGGNGQLYGLGQNHPNPFITHTWIDYSIPASGHVTLKIFNVNGDLVCTLLDENQAAGNHSVKWNGQGGNGSKASPGVYFYRIETGDFTRTGKMFMLR